MNKATFHSLSASEQQLVLETERDHLLTLDEDELGDLHDRVRRARNKFVKLYRREASAQVATKGARGTASLGGPRRNASKAEVFEEALARVSSRLAKLARQAAAELKAERIAAARGTGAAPGVTPARRRTSAGGHPAKTPTQARRRAPIEKKTASSSQAAGRRRQATRDAR